MSKRLLYLLCMALACAVFVAACGEDEGGDGGGSASEETGATEGAKVIDVASMENASGDVTYCTGKDTSGAQTKAIEEFNKANPDINAELLLAALEGTAIGGKQLPVELVIRSTTAPSGMTRGGATRHRTGRGMDRRRQARQEGERVRS